MDAPKLQFPCEYPIKVMIRAEPETRLHVDAVMDRHGGPGTGGSASVRDSAQGNFTGVTYLIQARDEAHIAALFAELKAVPGVMLVL